MPFFGSKSICAAIITQQQCHNNGPFQQANAVVDDFCAITAWVECERSSNNRFHDEPVTNLKTYGHTAYYCL